MPTLFMTKSMKVDGKLYTAGEPLPESVRPGIVKSLQNCGHVTTTPTGSELDQLDLDSGTTEALTAAGLITIQQLEEVEDFTTIANIGKGRANKISEALNDLAAAEHEQANAEAEATNVEE